MSKRSALFIFLAILALGAFFRFYQISVTPPGLYPDEAMNGNNALEALATGDFKVFYPENNGREGLFINIQALSLWFFGNEPWALRIVSAVFGTLTIFGVYLLTKELFSRSKRLENWKLPPDGRASSQRGGKIENYEIVALLSAFFLAASYWHINFSRIGFRAISVPFFATFGLYFLLKGLRQKSIFSLIWASVFIGLGFYSYLAFRFMPFVLAIPIIWYLGQWYHQNKKSKIKNQNDNTKFKIDCIPCSLALFVFITFIVSLPLILYFLQNPQDFIGRSGQVSIFSAESPFKEFLKSNSATLGMFFVRGDCNWRHNYACQPELYPIVAIFFIIGLMTAIRNLFNFQSNSNNSILQSLRAGKLKNLLKIESETKVFASDGQSPGIHRGGEFWRMENLLLLIWLIFMSFPATLTHEGLPHALRSIGMIPPVIILAALGAYSFLEKILMWFKKQKQKWPKYLDQLARIQKELILLFMLIMLLVPLATYRDYFRRWVGNSNTYFAFSTDLLNLGRFLHELPQDTKKYVVVNLNGVDVRGLPTPTQTVMFATDTFREDARRQKNIVYVTQENWVSTLRIPPNQKTLIAFLDNTDRQLIHSIKQLFPDLTTKIPGDFMILQNY